MLAAASTYVRVNGKWGVTAMIFKAGDANTVAVGNRLKEALVVEKNPALEGLLVRTPWNQAETIMRSIGTLFETLLWGGVLAAIVLLVFLKSWRLSLVIALSIPLCMTLTLAVMFLADETINLLTLMGFTLAGGMLLDNSIVVAENIYRRSLEGDVPLEASVRGAGEVGLALLMATSTTIIVFVSVIFLSDSEFISFFMSKIGLPVCVALAFSGAVALGVVPLVMLNAGMLSGRQSRLRTRFAEWRRRKKGAWLVASRGRKMLMLPSIVLWEFTALFAGRESHGVARSHVIEWIAGHYHWVIRRALAMRYILVPVALIGTISAIGGVYAAMSETDQNQGNRDRVELRIGFPGSSDILVTKNGLRIDSVEPGSPADKAGIEPGDILVRLNGTGVETMEDLAKAEAAHIDGDGQVAQIVRGQQRKRLKVEGAPLGVTGAPGESEAVRDAMWAEFSMEVERMLLGDPDVPGAQERASERYGVDSMSMSFNARRARMWIYLDPERVDQANEFHKNIMGDLPKRAGVSTSGEFQGGSAASSEVSVRISGPDTERLIELGEDVALRLEGIPGIEGIRLDRDEGMEEMTLQVERERATTYGVQPDVMSRIIAFQLSGTFINDYQRGQDMVPVRVRFAPPRDSQGRERPPELADISEIRVPTSMGSSIATKAVTSSSGLAKAGVGEIRRIDRLTSLRIVGTTSSDDLQRIRGDVERVLAGVQFPPGYKRDLTGRFMEGRRNNTAALASIPWAGLLVFLLMCFLFESILKPLSIILASVPGAILGGLMLLWLTDTPNEGMTYLGAVVLVGVVVNNGIVLVDLINRLRRDGLARTEAITRACAQRMRPIVLTSLTTAFGLIPMAIGDATFVGTPYYPMGRAVLGGLLVSMVYTLLLVPLLYTILDDVGLAMRGWVSVVFGKRSRGGTRPPGAVASPGAED